jgi:cellobiose phosphorylase
VTYHITVERAGSGNSILLTVDGKPIEGDIVPLPEDNTKLVEVHGVLK